MGRLAVVVYNIYMFLGGGLRIRTRRGKEGSPINVDGLQLNPEVRDTGPLFT